MAKRCDEGTGLYHSFCQQRFDEIGRGVNDANKGIIHIRKILMGDPISHIEGIVPQVARHEEHVKQQQAKAAQEEKEKRTDKRSMIASVLAAVAAIAAAIIAGLK